MVYLNITKECCIPEQGGMSNITKEVCIPEQGSIPEYYKRRLYIPEQGGIPEYWCQKYTNVSDVEGYVEGV